MTFRPKIKIESSAFRRLWRAVLFVLLAVTVIFIVINNRRQIYLTDFPSWYILLPVGGFFLIENAVKFWAFNKFRTKITCYVLDTVCLILFTIFSDGSLISTLYLLILSEFYLSNSSLSGCIAMAVVSIILFVVAFAASSVLKVGTFNAVSLITGLINDIFLLVLHFLIVNFVVQVYRKNKEITTTLLELNSANEELKRANEELREATAIKERQRIAKDIHDTAGHSITTIIMLTEAAKLCIDSDPADAKRKISAANIQAKDALNELRASVHLLSGANSQQTLKEMLESIVHESTDGTDIVIRSTIDDIALCDAKRRFICNTLKEGISNGLRHGNATAFYFELKQNDDRVEFLLSDNGTGMALSALKEGFGLSGMFSRAESLGGNVWFETEPDGGFEIHLVLPTDKKSGEK